MQLWIQGLLCLGAHAHGRYTVVCLCVCLLQLLKDQRSVSNSFYRLLVMFSILIRKIMFGSRVWNAIAAFSEQCVE